MNMTASRVAAFAIALLAVADPSVTSSRTSRPLVSVVGDSARDARLIERVERVLGAEFMPVRGALPASVATVLVGDVLPDETANLSAPVTAVVSAHSGPFARVTSLAAPAAAPIDAQVPIKANVAISGYRGPATVELHAGEIVVQRQQASVTADSASLNIEFLAVPVAPGPALFTVVARLEKGAIADSATTVVDAQNHHANVLFFDPVASWLSTFVRRAVEQDARFSVAHRVLTSRGLSSTTGPAPPSLRDAHVLAPYSVVIVGSPEQLDEASIAGLESFMRRRGGRVILLMDRRAAGPIDRLTGATTWRAARLPAAMSLESEIGNSPMRVREIAWPASLPAFAAIHASSVARDSIRRAVVWSIPVGAGRLMVSGALDSWHYRDATSGFDSFWTNMIAEYSTGAPDPIVLSLSRRSLVPNEEARVNVWIRDAALSNSAIRRASVSGILVSEHDSSAIRLWPDQTPGSYTATIVAPREAGVYRVIASSEADRAEAPLIVNPAARRPAEDDRNLIDAFASSRRGSVVSEDELESLPSRLASAIQSGSRVETWHPMRSAWWIVPFALLLGAEWWWRRRNGLA